MGKERMVEESQRQHSQGGCGEGNWNSRHSLLNKLKDRKQNYMSHLKLYVKCPINNVGNKKMGSNVAVTKRVEGRLKLLPCFIGY